MSRPSGRRILVLLFEVPGGLTDDEVHGIGERIVEQLITDEPVTFDGTEVRDDS